MKPSRILATILVSALVVLMMTGVAFAATTNSFGRTYSNINQSTDYSGCLGAPGCHAADATTDWGTGPGPFVVNLNAHSSMVTSIPGNLGALIPSTGAANLWPSPSYGLGIRFNPANVQFMIGGAAGSQPGAFQFTKEYVGIAGSALPAVSGVATVPAVSPADDYPLFDPIAFNPNSGNDPLGDWEIDEYTGGAHPVVGTAPYFQRCGQCHNVGVTKPSAAANGIKNLPITGSVDPSSTATTWQGSLSINCDACHGTGNVGNTTGVNHAGNGTGFTGYGAGPSITPKVILQAGVCGQCHATGSAVAADGTYIKRYGSTSNMSAPLGFTTNNVGTGLVSGQNSILTFFDIKTVNTTDAVWPAAGYAFYPNGANKGMNHGYFNEYVSAVNQAAAGAQAPWDTTRTVNLTPIPGGRGHINSWVEPRAFRADAKCMRCHSGDGRMAYIGRSLDPVNGKNIVSQSSFVETNFAGTDATTTAIAGVTCSVCHTAHSATENTATGGMGLRPGAACSDCHNWQFEVLEAPAAQRPSVANIAAGTFGWSRVSHPTREVVAGTAMLDIPAAGEFMEGAECANCHMPQTRPGRPTHSFVPMLPGNAKTWGVLENGGQDSCKATCHPSLSLDALQGKIDGWQTDFDANYASLTTALTGARTRKGWATSITSTTSTDPEVVAYKIANFNWWVAQGEGSRGVHNPEYENAGMMLGKKLADAIGGNVTGVPGATIVRSGDSIGFVGVATNGGTSPAHPDGAMITIQKSTNGGGLWSNVATTATDAGGNYQGATGSITMTTLFRAKWTVRGNPGELAYYSTPVEVTLGTGGFIPVSRLFGSTRYGTAVAASMSTFADDSVANIVVATGQNFPDALSAAGLAGTVHSPILLIGKPGDPLPTEVLVEIDRIASKDTSGNPNATVWFIGGTGPLPNAWMTDMEAAIPGISTTRVAGDNRYDTSAEVASRMHSIQGGAWSGKCLVATGQNFPDALAGQSVAYGKQWPILLANTTLPTVIGNAMVDEDIDTAYAIGGTGTIPEAVLTSIRSLPASPSITATRVAGGSTRYETAALFSRWAVTSGNATPGYVGIATGQNFPDALCSGGPIGTNHGVLLLTKTNTLDPSAEAFLDDYRAQISKAVIFGGTGAVSSTVFEQVSTVLNP